VIGQKYDFSNWLAEAFVDLLLRDASLTIDEGHRLGMQVVIAVSDGRIRMKQTVRSEAHDVALQIIREYLLPSFALGSAVTLNSPDVSRSPTPEAIPAQKKTLNLTEPEETVTITDDTKAMLVSWGKDAMTPSHTAASQSWYMRYLKQHPSHLLAVIDALLTESMEGSNHYCLDYSTWSQIPCGSCPIDALPTKPIFQAILDLKLISRHEMSRVCKDFVLRRISEWRYLLETPLDAPMLIRHWFMEESLTSTRSMEDAGLPVEFRQMSQATRLLRALIDKDIITQDTLNKEVFILFWKKMLELCDKLQAFDSQKCGNIIARVLMLVGMSVVTNTACLEIDAFYRRVTAIYTACGITTDIYGGQICHSFFVSPELILGRVRKQPDSSTQYVVNGRRWPQD
jgi:hypothetical protein